MSALDELEISAIRGGVDERVLNRARAERNALILAASERDAAIEAMRSERDEWMNEADRRAGVGMRDKAELIKLRSSLSEQIKNAVLEEREACAVEVEKPKYISDNVRSILAAAIRARGEKAK